MKKWLLIIILLFTTAVPVCATEITPPQVPSELEELMPADDQTFAEGLWYVISTSLQQLRPDIRQCLVTCAGLVGCTMLISILRNLRSESVMAVDLAGVVSIGCLLLKPTDAMIRLGVDTVQEICQYGQLLLPVMTAALAAQGGSSTSVALYSGTAFFNALLSRSVSQLLLPMVYIYLILRIVNAVTGEELVGKLSVSVKGIMTWLLKSVIYLFTGYVGITGVISGTTDQITLKAAKLTISGTVPVVGSILSDATQTILLSASVMKNSAGIYGIYAVLAITVVPFMKIAVQYLFLKLTAALCAVFSGGKTTELIDAFTSLMGFLLAVTGTVCIIQLISTVCFLKGMS